MDFTIAPNPLLELVNLSHHTQHVKWEPVPSSPLFGTQLLAGESAAADLITGGRIELGIARGAYSYSTSDSARYGCMGSGPTHARTNTLLPKLGEATARTKGVFEFPATTSTPKPVQEDGLPIWIAARDPSSHEFGVHNGFNIQVTPLWQGDQEIDVLMERFNAACATYSGPRPKIMLLHHTYVGKDAADVDIAAKELSRFIVTSALGFRTSDLFCRVRLIR